MTADLDIHINTADETASIKDIIDDPSVVVKPSADADPEASPSPTPTVDTFFEDEDSEEEGKDKNSETEAEKDDGSVETTESLVAEEQQQDSTEASPTPLPPAESEPDQLQANVDDLRVDADEDELASVASLNVNRMKSSSGKTLLKRAVMKKLGSVRKLGSKKENEDDDESVAESAYTTMEEREAQMKQAVMEGLLASPKGQALVQKMESGEISKQELEAQIDQEVHEAMMGVAAQEFSDKDVNVDADADADADSVANNTTNSNSNRDDDLTSLADDDMSVEIDAAVSIPLAKQDSFRTVRQREEQRLNKAFTKKLKKKKGFNLKAAFSKTMKPIAEDSAAKEKSAGPDFSSDEQQQAKAEYDRERLAKIQQQDEELKQSLVKLLLVSPIVMAAKADKNVTEEQTAIALRRITSNIVNNNRRAANSNKTSAQ